MHDTLKTLTPPKYKKTYFSENYIIERIAISYESLDLRKTCKKFELTKQKIKFSGSDLAIICI